MTGICQTHGNFNYDNHILYDDHLVDQIINNERLATSPFLLHGHIKSLHTIHSNPNAGGVSSIKYFYDKNKRVVRLKNYDRELHEVVDRTLYKMGNYAGDWVLKDGYSIQDKNRVKRYETKHDTATSLVVLRTYENDILKEVDSIFYEGNFLPVLIRHYEIWNNLQQLQSIKRNEYSGEKISLSVTVGPHRVSSGWKRFYDSQNRHIYVSGLKNINSENLSYTVEDYKNEYFEWMGKDFKYTKGENDTIYYLSIENKLIRNSPISHTITYLSPGLTPVRIEYYYPDSSQTRIIDYKYNSQGDLIEKTYSIAEPYDENEKYDYIYDDQQNWIERNMYINGELFNTTKRIIEYY